VTSYIQATDRMLLSGEKVDRHVVNDRECPCLCTWSSCSWWHTTLVCNRWGKTRPRNACKDLQFRIKPQCELHGLKC